MGAVLSLGNWATSLAIQSLTLLTTCFGVLSNTAASGSGGSSASAAKIYYLVVLSLFAIVSFTLRQYPEKIHINLDAWKINCETNDAQIIPGCEANAAIFRLSFVMSVFFLINGILATANLKFHISYWGLKFVILLVTLVIAFFLPNTVFDNSGYAWVARVGSFFFMLLQILILIEFAYEWNSGWMELAFPSDGSEHDRKYVLAIFAISFLLYLSVFIGMPMFFAEYTDCLLGLTFAAISLGLIIFLTACTLMRRPILSIIYGLYNRDDEEEAGFDVENFSGEFLPAAVISGYAMYLLWGALQDLKTFRLTPAGKTVMNECHIAGVDENSEIVADPLMQQFSLMVGSIFTILSLIYTAYSTSSSIEDALIATGKVSVGDGGTDAETPLVGANKQPVYDYQTLSGGDAGDGAFDDDGEAAGAGISVALFHLTMLTASMYIGMLLTNWGNMIPITQSSMQQDDVQRDFSEANMWVKIITQWFTIFLYIWTLIAPAFLPGREFS